MNVLLDRLNLRPQERRFLVLVVTISFVVLNLWFVWPRFGDWTVVKGEIEKARATLADYQRETASSRVAEYQARLKELEGEGAAIAQDEQSFDLARTIRNTALQCGISSIPQDREVPASTVKTNQYFEEKLRSVTLIAGEKELVEFLVSVGSSNSLIRARNIQLKTDSTGTRLQADITLVASYQRRQIVRTEPAAKKPEPAAAKPTPALRPKPAEPAKAAPKTSAPAKTPAPAGKGKPEPAKKP